jgi:hypothetical protein
VDRQMMADAARAPAKRFKAILGSVWIALIG